MTRTSIIIRIVFAIILFVSALLLYRKFVSWFLVDKPGITYGSDSLTTIGRHALLFSACFAFPPIGSIVLNLQKVWNVLISSLTLLLCVVAGILIKRALLINDINYILSVAKDSEERNEYRLSIEAVLPDVYMIVSLIIGLCLLFVLKRMRITFRGDSDESSKRLVSQLLSK